MSHRSFAIAQDDTKSNCIKWYAPGRRLKIGFVMDPMEKLLYRYDSSIAIMKECQKRGHRIFYLEPKHIFYAANSIYADVRHVSVGKKNRFEIKAVKTIDLKTLDIVFNRKDPPFDINYLYLTQLLALVESDVFVINSPRGLQKANEKLYILEWAKWIPPTIVTNDPGKIEQFRRSQKSDVILKPLDQKGGKGIRLLPKRTRHANRTLGQVTSRGTRWVMAQKFIEQGRTRGDKRILLLDGKMIGAFRRLPKKGEFRANLTLGGKSQTTSLTREERRLLRSLIPKLKKDGLYFAGLDVVGGRLIEINVTSPAGITEINLLGGARPEARIADFLEARAWKRKRR